jgi:hypothetical protein
MRLRRFFLAASEMRTTPPPVSAHVLSFTFHFHFHSLTIAGGFQKLYTLT